LIEEDMIVDLISSCPICERNLESYLGV
jgi:hypothetical protein